MRNRLLLEWLLVAGVAVLALCLLVTCGVAERPDNLAYDALVRLRPALKSDVVIVAIDEDSLGSIGHWPWPRDIHARLIDRLAAARPAAIAYDVLFVEPSGEDAKLAAAIARAGVVVLPTSFSVPGMDGKPFDIQDPAPAIARAARGIGHADFAADRDGIVRRASLLAGNREEMRVSVAELLRETALHFPSRAFRGTAANALPSGGFSLSKPYLIPFSGSAGFHRTVSSGAVLRGEVPPELLRGKVLLVGSTARGSGDQYPVPSGAMAGVELLANLFDAVAAERLISPAGAGATLVAALIPLFILLTALLLLPPRVNVLLGLALIVILVAVSAALLIWADVWVSPAAGVIILLVVYPLWAWRRLEAANAYMIDELTRLRREPDPLPVANAAAPLGWVPEAIARQSTLLHMAIGRVRDLRRFFADSLQALPDATLLIDPAGLVLVSNRAADSLFGPSTGLPLTELLRRLCPDLPAERETQAVREITAADGRIFVLAVVPLNDAAGICVGSIARLTDISEIRLAIRQREDALQLLTHDMRSPQASILALLDEKGGDEQKLRLRIAGYARRTLKLADDFVHYARAESARYNQELLDLLGLLIEAADDQWALAHARRIRIETPEGDDEFLVLGDRSLLHRMLCNLIGNAIKYSEPETRVRCTLARELGAAGSTTICCRIADEGHGIAPMEMEAIFRPFHRSGGAEKRGAGLGLAFVRTVVQRHGGTIEVDSALGQGTTFTIRLPQAIET